MSIDDEEKCKNEYDHIGGREPSDGEALLGRCYEICIGGQLDSSWSEWFEGFELYACGKNWTMLCGRVADQAALLGILNKLSRLNMPLVSVNEVGLSKCCAEPKEEGGE